MLDKFIESLTPEQKMTLIQSLSDSIEPEVKKAPEPVVPAPQDTSRAVSYTHLTLPTNREV